MDFQQLRAAAPHADEASASFTVWLDEAAHGSYDCLIEAINAWLIEDGDGGSATDGNYTSWLETVIYIVLRWAVHPDEYRWRRRDGEVVRFDSLVDLHEDIPASSRSVFLLDTAFLSSGFYRHQANQAGYSQTIGAIERTVRRVLDERSVQ